MRVTFRKVCRRMKRKEPGTRQKIAAPQARVRKLPLLFFSFLRVAATAARVKRLLPLSLLLFFSCGSLMHASENCRCFYFFSQVAATAARVRKNSGSGRFRAPAMIVFKNCL